MMNRLLALLIFFPIVTWAQTPPPPPQIVPPLLPRPNVSGPMCNNGSAALRAGTVERTLLEFHVGADGQITDVTILDSSGNVALNDAAIRCLNTWRADPSEAGQFGSLRASIFWN